MQIRSYRLPSLQGGANRFHGFPAVHRDMTFAVAGKKGLQQEPAGEIVFHQKHPQRRAAGPALDSGLCSLAGARCSESARRARPGSQRCRPGCSRRLPNQFAAAGRWHAAGRAPVPAWEPSRGSGCSASTFSSLVRQLADLHQLKTACSSFDRMHGPKGTIYQLLIDLRATLFDGKKARLDGRQVLAGFGQILVS